MAVTWNNMSQYAGTGCFTGTAEYCPPLQRLTLKGHAVLLENVLVVQKDFRSTFAFIKEIPFRELNLRFPRPFNDRQREGNQSATVGLVFFSSCDCTITRLCHGKCVQVPSLDSGPGHSLGKLDKKGWIKHTTKEYIKRQCDGWQFLLLREHNQGEGKEHPKVQPQLCCLKKKNWVNSEESLIH